MTKIKRIQPWRRFVGFLQAILIIGLPFLRIKGESALRFDLPSLRLHFFGTSLWMEEFFIVLAALIFLTFLSTFITLMFGRIWCGWVCPQTVIVDFTRFVDKKGGVSSKLLAYFPTLLISTIIAASLIWYFISPYEFFDRLFNGSLGELTWEFWIVLTGSIFLNFAFLRHKFCATVCPYAKLQSVLFDNKTLVIACDPVRKEECIKCLACVKACPVGIDIRKGLNAACINCAECLDMCNGVMGKKHKESLITYSFGLPAKAGRIMRPSAVMVCSITLLALIFLLYLAFSRIPLDMTVLPNYDFPPRLTDKGATNSYLLSLRNRGKFEEELEIGAKGGEGGGITIVPERVYLKAEEDKNIVVFVTIREPMRVKSLTIYIETTKPDRVRITRKAGFIIPEV
ncbi:MAG: 4Fe-4S binding protein [Candidatus Tectomicrobia bacterium]|uniref:4Fe-4S binding protein n=1 Tax=Tectimicrobiota bacterium TaxID=2528274 RepID=A0A933GL88_UNCTE|nr:4Fe-4S binding protein [Candidatus Tectomicrobia bacterium]